VAKDSTKTKLEKVVAKIVLLEDTARQQANLPLPALDNVIMDTTVQLVP
jgi:hypothetical protein